MPTDTQNLLKFFMFCHGNASVHVDWDDEPGGLEKEAWVGKAKMAFGHLRLLSNSSSEISKRIQEYEPIYGTSAKKKIPKSIIQGVLLFVVAVVVFGFLGLSSSRESDGEKAETARLAAVMTKTQQLVAERNFDAALMEATNLAWRFQPNHYSKDVTVYDNQRKELIDQINEARSNK